MKKNKDIKLCPTIPTPDNSKYHMCRCGVNVSALNSLGMCQHCRELDVDTRFSGFDEYENNYDDRLAAGFALLSRDGYYGD